MNTEEIEMALIERIKQKITELEWGQFSLMRIAGCDEDLYRAAGSAYAYNQVQQHLNRLVSDRLEHMEARISGRSH